MRTRLYRSLLALLIASAATVSTAAAQSATCVGDCSGNDTVTIDEILTGVNIALNTILLSVCPRFDANHDDKVTVDEILTAVNNALHGCTNGTPLPTATATRTPTPTIAIVDFGFIGYVANDGSGTVSVVDPTSSTLTTHITLRGVNIGSTLPSPSDIPTAIALDGLGAFGGVPALGGIGPQGLSKRISLAARSPAVDSGGLPRAIATDGHFAYVTSQFPDVVSVIDTARGAVVDTIDGLGLAPEAIALTADGRWAFVTNFASASVSVVDTDPVRRRVVSTVPVSAAPNAIALTPNGERAYITHFNRNDSGIPTRASVTVIDTMKARNDPTHAVVTTIALGDESEAPTGVVS